ncbi:MAG: adenosylcobinamide-phosphate synthase CbiB [Chloroflexota bacterium]|jgi:adenosylcobinamide-phosphate synthase
MDIVVDKEERWKVAALALLIDLAFGEPPDRWHPVVWMGKLVERLERHSSKRGAVRQVIYGGAAEALAIAAATLPVWLLERTARATHIPRVLFSALLLKPTFAAKTLFLHHEQVERALKMRDLEGARKAVGRIVSRDVNELDEGKVAAAAIESLAENAGDSVVAPLLFYAVFGLPGAYGYRMANTLDAMWGYRGRYEYLGKVAARVDDLANLIPSRLTALAFALSARAVGGAIAEAWKVALRDSALTASPNAGWPMAATAGALGLRLEKVGHYTLNESGRTPVVSDLKRSRHLVGAGLAVAMAGILLATRACSKRDD